MSRITWSRKPLMPISNNFFEELLGSNNPILNLPGQVLSVPAANVTESKEAFSIELAIPGKTKEDFKIEVDADTITISSEKETTVENSDSNYTSKEYSFNSFQRLFNLPSGTNTEEIKATYENGVLKIEIPKSPTITETKKMISVN